MKVTRALALTATMVALSACAAGSGGSGFLAFGCGAEAARHLEGVDWDQAKDIKIRIRQGEFRPTYLGLHQSVAYRLTLENADDGSHVFRASEFFTSIALAGISLDGAAEDSEPCIDAISLGGGETALVRFVAVRDGSYEFDDNSVMLAMAMGGNAGGFISIEPAPDLPRSPLDHLQLVKPPRSVTAPVEKTAPTGLFDDQPTPPPAPGGLFDDQPTPPPSPGGLFDDQPTPPPAPGGLFDDQTAPPTKPTDLFGEPSSPPDAPTGLFDLPAPDQAPAQPIEAAPSKPVEPDQGAPSGQGLFVDPTPEEPAPEEPPLVEARPGDAPPEPVVDAAPSLFETPPSEPPVKEEPPTVEARPKAPFDPEQLMVETPRETEQVMATPGDQAPPAHLPPSGLSPVDQPPEFPALEPPARSASMDGMGEGPPADFYSDPPDPLGPAPGGGNGGEDTLGHIG